MKNTMTPGAALTAVLIFLSATANAHDNKAGKIMVMKPWARATAGNARTGAAYLMLHNMGDKADKLIDAGSDVSKKTEIHLSSMKNGMMKMERVDGVKVPAKGSAELKPGSYHIMFMGLKAPLKDGDSFPLTLTFEQNGSVTVDVSVKRGTGMKKMDHSKMKHTN